MTLNHLSRGFIGSIAVCVAASQAQAQDSGKLAPNAPADRPVSAADICQWNAMVAATKPYTDRARSSYPAAKQRFIRGLPPKESFFVTAVLHDSLGHHEQVFIAVDSIVGTTISGRVWNDLLIVRGYRRGQRYEMPEADLVDWLIAKPDGTEEGNEVGKFLDTYTPPQTCSDRASTD
jgi:hypothetical protein